MLTGLGLVGFRNLEDRELEIPPEGVALVGRNAQGKSNFLEAVYYLEVFRSPRGTRDAHLISFHRDHFRLVGGLAPGGEVSAVTAAVQRGGSPTKKVTVDGREPERLGDAVGHLGAVLFTPGDVRLVSDGPGERRRFLDILLSVNHPGYLEALQRYRQVISHRNAALRSSAGPAAIQAWDALLSRPGGLVSAARAGWVRDVGEAFAEVYRTVADGEAATMEYRPATPGADDITIEGAADPDAWEARLRQALADSLEGDRERGATRPGPHRDDLRLRVLPEGSEEDEGETRDLREYGSGGQQRTAALALRMVEASTRARRLGRPPLLLLDDVFAELDEGRSRRILRLLDETATGQVLLTAPREADIRLRPGELARWTIEAGRIREAS